MIFHRHDHLLSPAPFFAFPACLLHHSPSQSSSPTDHLVMDRGTPYWTSITPSRTTIVNPSPARYHEPSFDKFFLYPSDFSSSSPPFSLLFSSFLSRTIIISPLPLDCRRQPRNPSLTDGGRTDHRRRFMRSEQKHPLSPLHTNPPPDREKNIHFCNCGWPLN